MKTHVMMDLETLGVVPGCVSFSIGAVEFFPLERRLGKEFYTIIDIESCLAAFLREEEDTKAWWARQSEEARVALMQARDGDGAELTDALTMFNQWLRHLGAAKDIRLYGNGADFDNPILRVMYDAAGVKPYLSGPAAFGGRCYRTLKNLDELFGPTFAFTPVERTGTYHNALDDARTQAIHLMDNLERIRKETLA